MRRIIWSKWEDPLMEAVREHDGPTTAFSGPVIVGAAGIIPLTELNCPSRNFNLWVGHSSFELTERTVAAAMRVEGVELWKTWTRYRFWLGVAKAHEEDQVKGGVRDAMLNTLPKLPKPPLSSVDAVASTARKKFPYWAVLMKGGKIDVFGGDDLAAVEREVDERRGQADRVVTSW